MHSWNLPTITYFRNENNESTYSTIRLFQYWILLAILYLITSTLLEVKHTSYFASVAFGWVPFTILIASHIHLLVCGMARFVLVFYRDLLEDHSDFLIQTVFG